jgi:hypothetical protein
MSGLRALRLHRWDLVGLFFADAGRADAAALASTGETPADGLLRALSVNEGQESTPHAGELGLHDRLSLLPMRFGAKIRGFKAGRVSH